MRIDTLKHNVATRAYDVDPVAVAEAMLRSPDARRILLPPSLRRAGARTRRAGAPRPRP
jgi:hypothetical protein